MLSTFSKSGLTVEILGWTTYKDTEGNNNSYLTADVTFEGNTRTDKIEGEMLTYILKNADFLGLRQANGDVQKNIPSNHYAEAYYDIIL